MESARFWSAGRNVNVGAKRRDEERQSVCWDVTPLLTTVRRSRPLICRKLCGGIAYCRFGATKKSPESYSYYPSKNIP